MSIELNPYLMLLVFITFMALIYLLNRCLFKPMLLFMESRDGAIEGDLSKMQQYQNEKEALEAQAAQSIALARKEAAQILEVATKEAKATYEEKINAKKSENEAKLAQYKQELLEQKSELYAELKAQLPLFQKTLGAKLKEI